MLPKACAEITSDAPFKGRDPCVIDDEFNGRNLAQGANPKLFPIGLSDPDGTQLNQMLVDVAKAGAGASSSATATP